MQLVVNGETLSLTERLTLADFLERQASAANYVVAVNETFVPRHQYQTTPLNDGDRIDIVQPMHGG